MCFIAVGKEMFAAGATLQTGMSSTVITFYF